MNTIVMFKHGLPPILHWHYEFIDDDISGTNTKKRDEFNHMIDECMAGNINMIITKAVVSADTLLPNDIQARLEELQKELIKKANHKQDYDAIADEILKLREQREKCIVDTAARDAQIARINELPDWLSALSVIQKSARNA